jgi:hypothetical protein
MTLNVVVILNVVLGVALLGLLAFVMAHPSRLRPHAEVVAGPSSRERVAGERARARQERSNAPWRPVLD